MNLYEITIYEKKEHWTFPVFIKAASLDEALKIAKKDFRSGYVVRGGARAS